MVRVLVVDDEAEVRDALRRGLEVLGFEIESAVDGATGLARVETWHPDVVLLDLAMPNMSGLTALRQIRGWSQVPIIVLSVMGEEADKVRALEAGADDYMTKPFGMQELQARIRVVLRRTKEEQGQSLLQFGDVQLNIDRRLVSVHDAPVHLSPIEYEIFKLLALAPGRVLTYRSLLSQVWGPNYGSEVHYLRPVVTALRKKLGNRVIKTEPGVGYRLEDPRA
jgi:two-component system KDP operon response regulator KdpE